MSENIKEIRLVPGKPFMHYVEAAVQDFPNGPDAEPRQRCRIRVEYGRADVSQLIRDGLDLDGAMQHYRDYIYYIVKRNIASDWVCTDGLDELLQITEEHVRPYYEKD